VVDLPATYGVVLGMEWCFPLGGYIMNNGNSMMFQNNDGGLTRVPCEQRNIILFKKKEIEAVVDYINTDHGNYAISCEDDITIE
jgi:hypothetical protein